MESGNDSAGSIATKPPFPPTGARFLKGFHSGFLEPWCLLANQPVTPPVLSGSIVIRDVW